MASPKTSTGKTCAFGRKSLTEHHYGAWADSCQICSCKGFTLLEVCIVMGLLAVAGSLGLIIGMESLRGGAFRNDLDAAVSALQRARSLAVNNMCFGAGCTDGKPHGVHFDPAKKEMVIFQGDSFNKTHPANETIEFDSATTRVDAPAAIDIIFDRLNGDLLPATATSTAVALKDNAGHASTIEVNSAGRINWSD